MNILIVNAFGESPSGKAKFTSFVNIIKEIFKKVSYKSGIGNFFYTYRTPRTIDDFLFDYQINPNEGSKSKLSNKKNFDKIDIVFIDGTEKYLPWQNLGYKLSLFIRLCKAMNKFLYCGGVALESLIYYLATGAKSEVNFINSKGEIQALEEIQLIPDKMLSELNKNDAFLDYVTGDIMEYRSVNKTWYPVGNIGLHKQIPAEKYLSRGRFVLPDRFTDSCNNKLMNNFVVSNCKELKINIQKHYLNHWLMKDLPNEFVCYSSLTWFIHYFNVSYEKFQFKTLCECTKGPIVIEHENTIGIGFHITNSFKDSVKILHNFISHRFKDVLDKLYTFPNQKTIKKEEEELNNMPNMFRYFRMNDETQKNKLLKAKEKNEIRPLTSIEKVNNSRPFCKIIKIRKEAAHCGFGFNNRNMIFVDDNSINQRPVSCFGMGYNAEKKLKNHLIKQQKIEEENLKQNIIKATKGYYFTDDIKPNENARISQIFRLKEDVDQKDNNINNNVNININNNNNNNNQQNMNLFQNSNIDKIKQEINKGEQNTDDYVGFIDKQHMTEDAMINYYKKMRKDICLKLEEIDFISEDKVNKLAKNFANKNDEFRHKQKMNINLRLKTANLKLKTKKMISGNDEEVEDNILSRVSIHNKENEYKSIFPYTKQGDLRISTLPCVSLNDIEKNVQNTCYFPCYTEMQKNNYKKLNLDSKNKSKYNKSFKKYDKDLNNFDNHPILSCDGRYLTKEEMDRREFMESKKKWICKEDFHTMFGPNTTSIKPIPNVMSAGKSVSLHKFREVTPNKWITSSGFKV